MDKATINILSKNSDKHIKTVSRALNDLELSDKKTLSKDLINLVTIYLRIDGTNQGELRQTLKLQIQKATAPIKEASFDNDFKEYLLEQSRQKDKQLKKKEKQIDRYSEAVVSLSNKLLGLVDDISMLRVEDSGTVQRLYDKNVLADLLTDLEPGSNAYASIELILKKMNDKN
jgi:alpha-galactosidase/6-phospho-beta-glucosidase family protein|tara:strand:- start:16986 stop:17504 length:519 start_codon:yes stop_codon:yes gene_type:complete